jgi:hypothetical protein
MKYVIWLAALLPVTAVAGIFPPAAEQPGSQAVPAGDADVAGWATGYQDYQIGLNVDAVFQTPAKALGEPGNSDGTEQGVIFDIVSLGTGGSITLSFSPPIANGAGFDFAVFENSFDDTFLELAKVEVSSDGINFVAFPAFSTVPAAVSSFGNLDPTDIEQVAGKYRGGFGTPFDLQQLNGSAGLDLSSIRYVRLVDIVGDGTATNDLSPQALADWLGVTVGELPQVLVDVANSAPAAIYDPYQTFGSAGFDLDAVGVLEQGTVPVAMEVDPWNAAPIDPDATATFPIIVYSSSLVTGDLDNFDATAIDDSELKLGYSAAAPVSGPFISDWDSDGLADAGYQFQTQDTGIACEDTEVQVQGTTVDGLVFAGTGAIATLDCPDSGCHP